MRMCVIQTIHQDSNHSANPVVLFKPLTSGSNYTHGCHSNHSPGLNPYGKSGGVIQTTHFGLKPYAWVSFKPFARTQPIREIWLVLFKLYLFVSNYTPCGGSGGKRSPTITSLYWGLTTKQRLRDLSPQPNKIPPEKESTPGLTSIPLVLDQPHVLNKT